MFKTIMVPVDLGHVDKLTAALDAAADVAKLYDATCVYVSVTSPQPGSIAHNPHEFGEKLAQFAADEGKKRGHATGSHMMTSHDPAVDIDDTLLKAADEVGADLVVMATHVPGIADMVLPNHGGHLASHAKISVFLVRAS